MKRFLTLNIVLMFTFFSLFSQETEKIVLIKTNLGNIEIKLFNETPKHRDNFLKLVDNHFYDSLLFHRVIDQFMVQVGDPESKNAKPNQVLGNGGPGYMIDAEINPDFFHQNGALAAARTSNQVNPERKSSGSQFYIVNGPVYSAEVLDKMQASIKNMKKSELFSTFLMKKENRTLKIRLDSLQNAGNNKEFSSIVNNIAEKYLKNDLEKIEKPDVFTKEQMKTYTTIGGTPHLDGEYTIFGQVINGMDVVNEISKLEADNNNRPLVDFKINTIEIIK